VGVRIKKWNVQEHKYERYDETVFAMITQNTVCIRPGRIASTVVSFSARPCPSQRRLDSGHRGRGLHDARTELDSWCGAELCLSAVQGRV
jgi:hypothetical protein